MTSTDIKWASRAGSLSKKILGWDLGWQTAVSHFTVNDQFENVGQLFGGRTILITIHCFFTAKTFQD